MSILLNRSNFNPVFTANKKYEEKPENTKFSAFYFNDWHGKKQTAKLVGLASAADSFMKENKDGFILCGGDTLIGGRGDKEENPKNNFFINFLNYLSEIAKKGSDKKADLISTGGNHEFDAGEANFAKSLEKANFKIVATNMHLKKDSPLQKLENKVIFPSIIAEKNGHYYGFIGAIPTDSRKRQSGVDFFDGLTLGKFDEKSLKIQREYENKRAKGIEKELVSRQEKKLDELLLKDTIKQLQKEVDKLTKDGINKIVLLSHLGSKDPNRDKEVAEKTTGIDVIIGAHSHNTIDGAEEGVNLLKNLDEEPVIITQAGKDGDLFGNLSLVFDEEGVIKPETIQNKVNRTMKQPVNEQILEDIKDMKEDAFGQPEKIAEIDHDFFPENPDTTENPITSLLMDSIKLKIARENKDIPAPEAVFRNSTTVRGGLKAPKITTEDIEEILPFESSPTVAWMKEKNIFSALQHGVDTIKEKAEMLQVSGLKYNVKNGKVTEAYFVDDENEIISQIDPDSDKEHSISTDRYLLDGGISYSMLKVPENKIIKDLDWIIQDSMKEHIKSLSKEELQEKLKPQGRINFTGNQNIFKLQNIQLNKQEKIRQFA